MISWNTPSSPLRKAVLLSLLHKGHQGSERLGACSRSHSSWELGMVRSLPLTATPHCFPDVWGSLWHRVPEPCVLIRSTGFVSMQALGSPTLGALMTYMLSPPWRSQTSQPNHSIQGLMAFSLPLHPPHFSLGNSDSLFKNYLCFIPIRITEIRKLD